MTLQPLLPAILPPMLGVNLWKQRAGQHSGSAPSGLPPSAIQRV
jgi:hypothetical protein